MGKRACLSLILALFTVASCSGKPAEHRSVPPNPRYISERCADLIVYGARGQTQSASANKGVGHEVLVTVDSLIAHLPKRTGTTVQLAAIPYPAVLEATETAYLRDIATGRRLLTASMAADAKKCPHSRLAVIGFSEGAQVVHNTIAGLPASSLGAIVAVALLADPVRNPHDPITLVSYGTGPLHGRGNAGYGTEFGTKIRDRIVTFCVEADNVCNAPLGGRVGGISDAHRSFYEKASTAKVTGKHLAELIADKVE